MGREDTVSKGNLQRSRPIIRRVAGIMTSTSRVSGDNDAIGTAEHEGFVCAVRKPHMRYARQDDHESAIILLCQQSDDSGTHVMVDHEMT
jgi:hypothetical protein